MIRPATPADANAIARIYNHYILKSTITFEEVAVTTEEMAERIDNLKAAGMPWLVAENSGQVVGYAYASQWKARSAYRYTTEITVYLDLPHTGEGYGTELYESLLAQLRGKGAHVVLACIALPNQASIALHEKFGLRKVAHFNEVGSKFGQWLDVGYWQVLL
ncbi:MAG: phosphinothricin acetyltransferase [Proteobacteria bacterium]|nr:phosphinothricin acetyltransferase [Pseudomonadota bacterium]